MLKTSRVRMLVVPCFLVLLVLTGSGCKRTVSVSGTVEFPEEVKFQTDDLVHIIFVPESKEETKAPFAQLSRADKTFECKEITPGAKYKITAHIDPNPTGSSPKRPGALEAFNKKYDRASTKLTYQASEEASQSITIDFAKGTVTKK